MKGWILAGLILILIYAIATNVNAATPANWPTNSCFDKSNNDPSQGDQKIDCADRWTSYGAAIDPTAVIGERTCPMDLHPYLGKDFVYCPHGEAPICSCDSGSCRDEFDGNYYAGWVCPQGAGSQTQDVSSGDLGQGNNGNDGSDYSNKANDQPQNFGSDSYDYSDSVYYNSEVPTTTSSYYQELSDLNGPDYYGSGWAIQGSRFQYCGDGICSYGEEYSCLSDCGRDYPYDYNNYGGYIFDYGYGSGYGYDSGYCYLRNQMEAYEGERVPIDVIFDGYAPYSINVNCGDGGSTIAYGSGYYGYDNVLTAYCRYTYQGIFKPSAYTGGISCYGSMISVGRNGGDYYDPYEPDYYQPTYQPTYSPTYTPTYYPTPTPEPATPYLYLNYPRGGEAFTPRQTITLQWVGRSIDNYKVFSSLDGGTNWEVLQSAPYYDTNIRWVLPNSANDRLRVKVEGFSSKGKLLATASSGEFSVESAAQSCALSAFPSNIKEGDSSAISVSYYGMASSPNTISISCGDGSLQNAVGCSGTSGSCSTFCDYENSGSYKVNAKIGSVLCAPVTVKVGASTADKCSDGTQFGQCSISMPKYCDEGILIDRASDCGCPQGKIASGNRCIVPSGSCNVNLNPSSIRANGQTSVIVNYNGIDSNAATIICGNGQTQSASCNSNGDLSGSCSATCAYGEEETYPTNYVVKANVKGTICSSANLAVSAPSLTTGTLLTKVSSCSDGSAIQNARVSINGHEYYYTDANGQLKVSLEPANYNLEVSKQGYLPGSVSANVIRGKIASANICLNSEGCDISAELVRTPQSDDSRNPLMFQIRLTNNLNDENELEIDYSSALRLNGPTRVVLQGKEAQTITIYAYSTDRVIGSSAGTVSIKGLGNCAKNIDLPINVIGGLSIELTQDSKETFSGKKACFDFLVRNKGTNEGTVTLTYSGDVEGDFNVDKFYLNSLETKDSLEFCADVESGASGSKTITIRALSPISDAFAYATINVLDSDDFEVDREDSCIYVQDEFQNYPITIDNDVADGDYSVSLRDNDANARITPSMLYNFKKGTSRIVYISANPKNIQGRDDLLELVLKRDDVVAMQKEICISSYFGHRYNDDYYDDYYYDGHYYYNDNGRYYYNDNGKRYYNDNVPFYSSRDIYSMLSQNTLNLQKGGFASTTLTIRNTGVRGENYFIRVQSPIQASVSQSSFYLAKNEEKQVIVRFSASANEISKRTNAKIMIYSGTGSGGVIYDDNYYNYRDGYDNQYGNSGSKTAFVQCNNGKTVALDCPEGSASCSATCRYTDTGSYTLRANVGNQECKSAQLRIIPDNSRGCAIATESYAPEDSRVQVRVRYFDLPSEIQDSSITIYCGNGRTATADDCDGKTGTCTSSCLYDSKGTFTLSGSAGATACTTAEIKVDDDSSFCSISTPGIAREGDTIAVNLKYRNAYFGGQFYPTSYATNDKYDYYSGSGKLLKTETVTLVIDGGFGTSTITPSNLQPQAIDISKVTAGVLPANGKGNVAVVLRNTRDYKLSDVSILVDGLPSGVSLIQVKPFALEAKDESAIYFQLYSENAKQGSYKPKVIVRVDGKTSQSEFDLVIGAEGENLNAEISVLNVEYAQSGSDGGIARVLFDVKNLESSKIEVSALILDLPQEWNVQIEPALAGIMPGKSINFSANISAKAVEQKAYTGTIELRSPDGRKYGVPIVFEFQKLGLFSGLFTFFGGFGWFQWMVILILVGILLYALFWRGENGEQVSTDEEEAENVEESTHERIDRLAFEIKPKNKQTILLDEEGFAKKKKSTVEKTKLGKRAYWGSEEEYKEGGSEQTSFIELDDDSTEDSLSTHREEDDE